MTTIDEAQTSPAAAAEEVSGRLFMEGVGAFHLLCVHVGRKLGLYRALADAEPLSAAELAERTGLDQRYVREWLQAEATAGLVTVDGDIDTGRFALAPGVRETLVEETSPFYVAGLAPAVAAAGATVSKVVDAFRSGEGVAYAEYGTDAVEAQAALNRPAFTNSLVTEWLPAVPDVLASLQDTARPARVADFGCGVGWSSIELARAFPHIRVDGIDSDDESISQARQNAAEHGVAERVDFEVGDISAERPGSTRYDLVLFFEVLHDLGHPVEALTAARNCLSQGGSVIVMDERVAETLPPPGEPVETFFAAASVLWCLPQGRVDHDSEAVGTVMRPGTLRELAGKAGYRSVDVLPIEHPFWRFYRLTP
jgi:2-polyprenyl-3-methyl-5-hydroxy-6-metoxy-1,4-benzoquinol methylase